ncbi:EAL domain-containing protein [Actinoplanes sp. NPDC049681]|uniref:EAL domain-containing protein n=1 Tax=Actinoplanes sp. NPDC049681 TaxID=3363905 RepID=UPI0037BD57D5
MTLDDIMELAAAYTPSALDRARSRRALDRLLTEYDRAVAEGRDVLGDLDEADVREPDEATRVKQAAESAGAGWMMWDAGSRELTWSPAMARMFGYSAATPADEDRLTQGIHAPDRAGVRAEVERGWRERVPVELTFRLQRLDGPFHYVRCLVQLLTPDGETPTGLVATVHDVTRQEVERQEQRRTRRRARIGRDRLPGHDPVSAFLGRDRFADELDRAARAGSGALLVVAVEPTRELGDEQSRQVTRAVAGMLAPVLPPGGRHGILGPTEFGFLAADRATATSLLADLQDRLGLSTVSGVRLRSWAGLVPFAAGAGVSGRDLVLDAAAAWRESRRAHIALTATSGPRSPSDRRNAVEAEIGAVLRAGRLRLYAQPILDLALNAITRHEILLRTTDGRNRSESPVSFLAAAERGEDIVAVDRWVVDRSLALIGAGAQESHFQINVSGRTVSRPGLAAHVLDALARHRVDPRAVTFEITESTAIDNLTAAAEFAAAVRRRGCELALDDFGTGYSSLYLLKYLPIDLVKIDGDFIARLPGSEFDRIAVQAVVDMCRALGVRTAAERVEDPATVDLLRGMGVNFAQGYAIAHPRPLAPSPAPSRLDRATG